MDYKDNYLDFNINKHILVKLSDKAYRILIDESRERNRLYPKVFDVLTLHELKSQEDENGYTRFQMWEFMEKFGKHMGMGRPNIIIDNMLITLEND